MRLSLRKKHIRLQVVKNSLARRVFGELGMDIGKDSPYWVGTTWMAYGPESVAELSSGRLPVPPAELSCRTRLETRFTRMLGLPTFSNAFLQSSAFKVCLSWLNKAR